MTASSSTPLPPRRRVVPAPPRESDLRGPRRALAQTRGTGTSQEREAFLALAHAALQHRREFEALVLASRAVVAMDAVGDVEGGVSARLDRASALSLLGDLDRLDVVLRDVEPAIASLAPDARALHERRLFRMRAEVFAARGRPEEALASIRAVLRTGGSDVSDERRAALLFQSDVLLRLGDLDGCTRRLHEAAQAGPADDARGLRIRVRLLRVDMCRASPDAVSDALEILDDLETRRGADVGPAARRELALLVADALGPVAEAMPVVRRAYDLAATAAIERLAEIARFVRDVPESATPTADDLAVLEDHRRRTLDAQSETYAAVARLLAGPTRLGRLPARTFAGDGELTCVCAWCQRVRTRTGTWLSIQQFLPLELEGPIALTHGICEACLPSLRRQIDPAKR